MQKKNAAAREGEQTCPQKLTPRKQPVLKLPSLFVSSTCCKCFITSMFPNAINHILRAELHGFGEQERSILGRKTASESIAYNDASKERFGPGGAAYSIQ